MPVSESTVALSANEGEPWGSAEAFYRAGGDPAPGHTLPPEGPLPIERIKAAAAQTGHQILGPPPF